MKKILFTLLFFPTLVYAQSSSLTTAILDGTVSCRRIVVSVNQTIQSGGSSTTISYIVRECEVGATEPTKTIFEGFTSIAPTSLQSKQTTITLLATTKDGTISLTWKATNKLQMTSDGTATTRENGVLTKRVQENTFYSSAAAEGNVLGFPVASGDRPAHFYQSTHKE